MEGAQLGPTGVRTGANWGELERIEAVFGDIAFLGFHDGRVELVDPDDFL